MPRHKAGNKSTRGNSQNASRGGSRGGRGGRGGSGGSGGSRLETTFVPFKGATATARGHNGFTLQEEARNTERHQSFWNTDQRLRDTKVSFVSAGTLGTRNVEDGDPDLAKMSLDDLVSGEPSEIEATEVDRDEDAVGREERVSVRESEPANSYFIDVDGSNVIQTGLPPPHIRSVSPTPSTSSEEILLFAGRDEQGRGIIRDPRGTRMIRPTNNSSTMLVGDGPTEQDGPRESVESVVSQIIVVEEDEDEIDEQEESRRSANSFDSKIRVVEDRIHEQEDLLEEVLQFEGISTSIPPSLQKHVDKGKAIGLPSRSRKPGRNGRGKIAQDLDDALMADYIANMDPEELEAMEAFGARELGDEDDIWVETEASANEPAATRSRPSQGEWSHSDLEDFDDLSTSDGVMGEVQEILSKRHRHRGVQYLVVWEDQATDEARWVPATTLTSVQALAQIEGFEAEEKLVAEFRDVEDEDQTDSEEIDDDAGADDYDDEDDDQDLLDRAQAAMTDEKIARLLAKQEAYGMGSDELLLFDDNDDYDGDEKPFLRSPVRSIMASNQSRRGKGPSRARGDFPSATLMADAYDGFDIMDFERPSLMPKSKGRRGKPLFDLSDSELESAMQMAWENDRTKKARRKQQREELRAQGLLGSKFGKPDMKHKYKEGMGIMDVVDEIKTFLKSIHTTLALPPMEKADRKIVHELSLKCNLKSLSKGNGNKRAPVLTKTGRTLPIPDSTFDTQVARLTRRFLPRMDISGKHAQRGPKVFGGGGGGGGRGGGFNTAAVSYRDGDIVGGSAPELGAENRGRAMLEKMGWSSGTALGALNNKGIMQPVTHVVKTTKAGLG